MRTPETMVMPDRDAAAVETGCVMGVGARRNPLSEGLQAAASTVTSCPCFPGCCRGGQVVAGRLANGLVCKAVAHV